jgi:hypothetical protein
VEAQQRRLLTTRAVMLEIGNALAKPRNRAAYSGHLDHSVQRKPSSQSSDVDHLFQ